jgi:pimeloyl-ACP methyl ester carboxylesterase
MLAIASERNNQQAVVELGKVKIPFRDAYDLYYHRGWLSKLDGQTFPSYETIEKWARRWLALYREACEINFFETTPELSCPLYVFVGTADYQTNYALTTDYFNFVKAPVKRLFLFEDVGHSVPFRQPVRLQKTIVSEILSN